MTVSNAFLRFGVLCLIVGVSLGIWMGANQNFTLRPIHVHTNLLGWASMMIFGLFYRVFPEAGAGWAPKVHLILSTLGLVTMMGGLTFVLLGKPALLPVLQAGEAMSTAGILLFAWILFRATGARSASAA